MYEIISGGKLLALADSPRYIRRNETSGCYVEAAKEDAIGVAVAGEVYNLPGGTAIPDAPEAFIRESDASEYVFRNRVMIEENAESAEAAFIQSENALCELDETTESRMSALEDAVCELDEIINGGNK